ncbi:MAG: CBS domain-containing protein [Acidilobus sp.]
MVEGCWMANTSFGRTGTSISSIRSSSISDAIEATSLNAKVPSDARIPEVRKLMRDRGFRTVAVIEGKAGRVIGIITRGDVLMVSSSKSEATAGSLAYPSPVTLAPSTSIEKALTLMLSNDLWEAPVINEVSFAGFFGLNDVIRALLDRAPGVLEEAVVRDYMTPGPVFASSEDFIARIWRKMIELKYAGLPVTDDNGRLVGMITQYDLLAKGYTRIHLESESGASKGPRVKEAMTRSVMYVTPWSRLSEAARLMVIRGFGRIPVVDDPKSMRLVGIVDREDVVKVLRVRA